MTIGAIIQARTSSSRLPQKILKELPFNSKITVLEQIIRRIKRVKPIQKIIIATTTDSADIVVERLAEKENVYCFRGSKENVLERYYLAAKSNKIDPILRITADNPCVDPDIVNNCINHYGNSNNDYVKTESYPLGLNIEMISLKALNMTYELAVESFEKEHVTPFIYKSHPEKFNIRRILAPKYFRNDKIRLTLDTIEDYSLLCAVYDYLYSKNQFFSIKDILELFHNKPWLSFIMNKRLSEGF